MANSCIYCGDKLSGVDLEIGICYLCYEDIELRRMENEYYEALLKKQLEDDYEALLKKQLEDEYYDAARAGQEASDD